MRHPLAARLILVPAVLLGLLTFAPAAHADSRVTVANPSGDATVDPTYATTVRVSGSGFQSVRNGHGGIYVFFGTVQAGWQPSRGGATGSDYFYVPDSEARNNQGYQRYVAFPGSDTAGSANGGAMTASGSWSTELVVPGAVFRAYDRAGKVRTIDCRKVTCGVITVGAHGVSNARNETFTPVAVGDLTAAGAAPSGAPSTAPPSAAAAPTGDASAAPGAGSSSSAPPAPGNASTGKAALEVDRASAAAGNVLAFTARGLPAGAQVSAVFDDGAAAAGPFAVGADGRLAGVITLPAATTAGTHELRLFGLDNPPSVRFAVRAGEVPAEVSAPAAAVEPDRALDPAWLFAAAAGLVLVLALGRLGLRMRRRRAH